MGKNYVNDSYFKHIDTEAKAYFIGFLTADGGILKGSHTEDYIRVGLHINIKDLEIVERFKDEIESTHTIFIGKKFNDCALRFVSKAMVADLSRYGIVPKKTGIENLKLDDIPHNLHKHVIRGLIDGDGWISTSNTREGRTVYSLGLCGSEQICKQVTRFLADNLEVGILSASKVKDKNCYKIGYTSIVDIEKITKYLYKDSTISLSRKYALASSFYN